VELFYILHVFTLSLASLVTRVERCNKSN